MAIIEPPSWRLALRRGGDLALAAGRPRLMGIVNITPDSFSDGGRFLEPEHAVRHALGLIENGADLLDLGAASSRPGGSVYGEGARDVSVAEEIDRLLPVLEALRAETDLPLSVDTRKGAVAREALRAGADLINDVGCLRDPELVAAVAAADCPAVIMHSRGTVATMQRDIAFEDVATEVAAELDERCRALESEGVARTKLILDPGIGFGKTAQQNLELLARAEPLARLGRPVLVGASRKSFIAAAHPALPERRLGGSLAAAAWAVAGGAAILRVHDVAETFQFLRLWEAIQAAQSAIQ